MENQELNDLLAEYMAKLDNNPSHPGLACSTAELAYRLNNIQLAIDVLNKAVELSPEDEWLQYRLAQTYFRNNQLETAKKMADQLWNDGIRTAPVKRLLADIEQKEKSSNDAQSGEAQSYGNPQILESATFCSPQAQVAYNGFRQ